MKTVTAARVVLAMLVSSALAGCMSDYQGEGDLAEEDTSVAEQMIVWCSEHGCTGQDPDKTGCSYGAYTLWESNVYRSQLIIGLIELRWSPTCKTKWARLTRSDGLNSFSMATTVWRGDGVSYTTTLSNNSKIWTKQVYAPTSCAYAYGRIYHPSGSSEQSTPCVL